MAGLKKNKKYWTGFIFAALTLFVSFPLNAQDTRYGIPPTEYFNRSEYNGGSQNWSITQSNHDILYFANNEGVLEYDGVSWNIYKDMGPYIVRSVRSVNNKIYVGTYSEMGYFSYENNHGLRYTSLVKDENLRSNTDYWNIHQWNDKIVFHSEQAIYIMKDDSLECIIPAVSRFSRSFLVNGMLLVHDDAEGLMEIRGEHVYPVSGGGILKDKLVTSLLPVSEDEIIIGTMEDGLYKWDMQSVRRWDVPASEVLQMANIYCGTNYRNKYLVFGTIQSGVVITDRYGKIIFQIGKDKGLNNNTVLSLFTDRDANLWAGLDNGIVKINLQASITFLQGFYDLGTGYSISRINNVWYFGTNQALYSISDEQFSSPFNDRYNFVRVPGTNGQVWNLYNTGKCILCGHNSGVFRVDENGAELITPPSINGVWIFKNIPGEDDLLIAGTYNGLILLEKKNNRWQYKSKIEGFNESSRYIEWDQNEDLWMSHGYEGIYRLKFDNNYTEVVAIDTFDLEENHELKPAPVISRVDGKLLINSSNGIFYVSEYGKIERYPDLDEHFTRGFPDRVIQDGFRNIWYFTGRHTGVLRYLEDGTYKNIVYPFIPLENKLVPSFESVFVYDNDNILFGAENGFAHYKITEEFDYHKPFKLHIRSFRGNSDTLQYVMNQDEDYDINYGAEIPQYRFRDNIFEINYAATCFREGYVEYSTYLSNYDLESTSWSRNTSRQFARLEEGIYEFVVKARNSFGVQSEPVVFNFKVLPPWHRTLIAKIVYLILVIVFILLLIIIFNRRVEINRQKEQQRQKESYRVKEEQLKSEALEVEKELIRIRNERLRNEMIFKEKELANTTMNILQKNKSMIKMKSEMLKIVSLSDNSEIKKQLKRLAWKIERDIDSEDYWKVFEVHLEQVHEDFLKRLSEKHPDLTNRERRLCAYIKMGMSSKEIAALINISFRAVENNRYRLRQKLNLAKGENLANCISNL